MEPIKTDQAPAAVGPYSQAVKTGQTLFCSGQIGLVPPTGKMAGEDIRAQTLQVLNNLAAVLEAAGIRNVVSKCLRSHNPHNLVKATLHGLCSLRSPEGIARARGKTVEEILT